MSRETTPEEDELFRKLIQEQGKPTWPVQVRKGSKYTPKKKKRKRK